MQAQIFAQAQQLLDGGAVDRPHDAATHTVRPGGAVSYTHLDVYKRQADTSQQQAQSIEQQCREKKHSFLVKS